MEICHWIREFIPDYLVGISLDWLREHYRLVGTLVMGVSTVLYRRTWLRHFLIGATVASLIFTITNWLLTPPPTIPHILSEQQTLRFADGFKSAAYLISHGLDSLPIDKFTPRHEPNRCQIYVTAAPGNVDFRDKLSDIASHMGCADFSSAPALPTPTIDIDSTSTATSNIPDYIVIRTFPLSRHSSPTNIDDLANIAINQAADNIRDALRSQGLDARQSHKLSANSMPGTIYVELNDVAPWNH